MSLDTITSVFRWIDRIPSTIKTVIIVVLFGILTVNYIKTQNEDIIRQYMHFTEMTEQRAEEYTLETAADINRYVEGIVPRFARITSPLKSLMPELARSSSEF